VRRGCGGLGIKIRFVAIKKSKLQKRNDEIMKLPR
jgi:hypothetical protein